MKKIAWLLCVGVALVFANDFLIESQIKRIDKQIQTNASEQKHLLQEKTRLENQQRMRRAQKPQNQYKAPQFGTPKNDWYGAPRIGW